METDLTKKKLRGQSDTSTVVNGGFMELTLIIKIIKHVTCLKLYKFDYVVAIVSISHVFICNISFILLV